VSSQMWFARQQNTSTAQVAKALELTGTLG
jgi:hypothetical protein